MLRLERTFAPLALTVALLTGAQADAVPIDVVETTDFGTTNTSSTFLGTMDVGVNVVSGAVDRMAGDGADFWHADVPTGLQITSIEISVSSTNGTAWRSIVEDRFISTFDDSFYQAWLTTSGDGDFDMPATLGALPFPAGRYHFANITFLNPETSHDYSWRVHVAAVPEPGTAMLIGLGLAALSTVGSCPPTRPRGRRGRSRRDP